MSESSRNGSTKLVWWIMSGAVGLLLTIVLTFIGHVQYKFAEYDHLTLTRGERLIALETSFSVIMNRLTTIEQTQKELLQLVTEMRIAGGGWKRR